MHAHIYEYKLWDVNKKIVHACYKKKFGMLIKNCACMKLIDERLDIFACML